MIFFDNDNMQESRYCDQSRGKTVNKRFFKNHILYYNFQSDIEKRSYVFFAIAVLTQISLKRGEPLFEAKYVSL